MFYEYFTKSVGLLKQGDRLELTLEHNDDFRLYSFVPYHGEQRISVGRTDLFMGVACQQGNSVGYISFSENGMLSLCEENTTV